MSSTKKVHVMAELGSVHVVLPYAVDHPDPIKSMRDLHVRMRADRRFKRVRRAESNPAQFRINYWAEYLEHFHSYVRLGSPDPKLKGGGIELELAPEQVEPSELEEMASVLRKLVGHSFEDVCQRAWVSRVEIKVQIHNVDLQHVAPKYTARAGQSVPFNLFDADGRIKGMQFGAVPSDALTASLYDGSLGVFPQTVEVLRQAGHAVETMDQNLIEVERSHWGPQDKTLTVQQAYLLAAPLRGVADIENRLTCYSFAERFDEPVPGLSQSEWAAFQCDAIQRGYDYAIGSFAGTQHEAAARDWWSSRQCAWWAPESYWDACMKPLRRFGSIVGGAFGTTAAKPALGMRVSASFAHTKNAGAR